MQSFPPSSSTPQPLGGQPAADGERGLPASPPSAPFPPGYSATGLPPEASEQPPRPRRHVARVIVGLGVGLVGVALLAAVVAVLLIARTPHGVSATWNVSVANARATTGDSVASSALAPGSTYLVVDVTVQNVTNSAHDFAGYIDFTAKDGNGAIYKTTYFPGATPPDGTIGANASLSGSIAFQVPASQHTFTLIYNDAIYGTQQWTLNV
jgi:hypothetical protein